MTFRLMVCGVLAGLVAVAACSVVNKPDDPTEPEGGSSATGGSGGGVCGDGVVASAAGETCDPPSSCPSCDDMDACTDDTVEGAPETCDVVCQNTPITACRADADGCCPAACDGSNDLDCATCGNGIVELGETCDGDCPASCAPDGDFCTSDELQGTAASCDVECGAPITTCDMVHDGCCPAGCTVANDIDCTNDVLLVVNNMSSSPDVQNMLASSGAFDSVSVHSVTDMGVPVVSQLIVADVLFVYNNTSWPTDAAGPLGDVVADYYDRGGRVVTATFTACTNAGLLLAGRWANLNGGYTLIAGSSQAQPAGSLGIVYEPQSPLMNGVTQFSATTAFRCPGTPANGGVVVAAWDNGDPLIVRGTIGGRNRVDLNFFPPGQATSVSYWIGDGLRMMINALQFE